MLVPLQSAAEGCRCRVLLSLLSECLFLRGQGSCEEVLEEGYALPGMMDSVGWD